MEGKKTPALKKFEVYVIYSSNKSSKVRVRKVKFGYYGEIDRDTCESERFQHMREQYKKLLIDSEDFSHDVFVETGAFFNPKFWDINVQWLKCSAQRQEEYIQQIDDFLVAKYSAKAYDLHNNNKV